jgi:hypothetical protein
VHQLHMLDDIEQTTGSGPSTRCNPEPWNLQQPAHASRRARWGLDLGEARVSVDNEASVQAALRSDGAVADEASGDAAEPLDAAVLGAPLRRATPGNIRMQPIGVGWQKTRFMPPSSDGEGSPLSCTRRLDAFSMSVGRPHPSARTL